MALIIMAVYDTEQNGRTEYTAKTLDNLCETVDWNRHKLIVVDNGSCKATKQLLSSWWFTGKDWTLITNETNLGTAAAINQGIRLREEGEYVIKIDNDVEIHTPGWVDLMEEAMNRESRIGVLGLKRKDLAQSPYNPDWPSELIQLPHVAGERWLYIEKTNDIMGTCTMLSPRLLDAVGYYYQPAKYGFDDSLLNIRSSVAGFWNAFLIGVEIDHLDTGEHPYTQEKHKIAGDSWDEYTRIHEEYVSGRRSVYYDGKSNT